MQNVPHPPQPVSSTDGAIDTARLTARSLWEPAVCLAATKARAALPHSNGRIDKAQQLVLDGAMELLDDHTARVTSQQDGTTQYYVVNGTCQCRDFPNAPQGQCKHSDRARHHRARRAVRQRTGTRPQSGDGAPCGSPRYAGQFPAPHSSQFLVEIQGKPFITFQGLLHLATQQGLRALTEEFTHVTDTYVLAQARAEFHDGRVFRGAADSTPDNVGKQVKPRWRRMALTRAQARCLRAALNVTLVAVEELD